MVEICHNPEEYQYLELVQQIIKSGNVRQNRTIEPTKGIFNAPAMTFSLRFGKIPLLTTKRVHWDTIVHELIWFINGSTNEKELSKFNVNIWKGNTSREFLDGCGFRDREEGDAGPIYGFQWRHWGANYIDAQTNYKNQGFDQLKHVIHLIKNDPTNRRIILSAWNVSDLSQMVLPPCHMFAQFYVYPETRELSCRMYQRSGDVGLGVPFNIASYSLLTHLIAHVCGLKAREFIHTIGDAHIYCSHEPFLLEQIKNKPRNFPRVQISSALTDITNNELKLDHIELFDYNPHSLNETQRQNKMKMAV